MRCRIVTNTPAATAAAALAVNQIITVNALTRTDMLVVFPGWLQHYVHPYRGTRPRIAIACNVTMSPMERRGRVRPSLGISQA